MCCENPRLRSFGPIALRDPRGIRENRYNDNQNAEWGEFAFDCIEPDPEGEITKEELYKKYCEFCKFFNYPTKINNVFSREIKPLLPRNFDEGQSRKKGRKKVWRGIKCTWERGKEQVKLSTEEPQEKKT